MQTTQPASGDYGTGRGSCPEPTIISTENLSRSFGWGDGAVTAVNDVELAVSTGEFLSLVGRSGSGKHGRPRCAGRLVTRRSAQRPR